MSFLKKYRTSHGFGVHSPLAFRFITEALRGNQATYYCYSHISDKLARRMVRVACFVNPASVLIVGTTDNQQILTALECVAGHISADVTSFSPGDGLIVACSAADEAMVVSLVKEAAEVTVAVEDMRLWKSLVAAAGENAMSFTDGREGFILKRVRLPHAQYTLKFR